MGQGGCQSIRRVDDQLISCRASHFGRTDLLDVVDADLHSVVIAMVVQYKDDLIGAFSDLSGRRDRLPRVRSAVRPAFDIRPTTAHFFLQNPSEGIRRIEVG